tara:strand:- start:1095 stop:1433 length:339 start_codon:yes stop_codon:yes gene_type:complete
MATLNTKIKLYAAANSVASVDFDTQVILKDNGDGVVYIAEWNLAIAEPTAEQIASYETAGNTAETLNGVLNKRASEYPTLQDQMDMQYKDLLNGTTTWKDAVAKVKSDNPKE